MQFICKMQRATFEYILISHCLLKFESLHHLHFDLLHHLHFELLHHLYFKIAYSQFAL